MIGEIWIGLFLKMVIYYGYHNLLPEIKDKRLLPLSNFYFDNIKHTEVNTDAYFVGYYKEDRIEEARIAAEKKQAKEAADKRYNDSIAAVQKAQKEKDDANPYYKDREFKYDDYYDYEYATRVRRFNNRIDGLSYYDNYYTNSYWYNPNPYNYLNKQKCG